MLRDLEIRNLPFTEFANLGLRGTLACFQTDPCEHDFTQTLIGNPDHLHFRYFWVCVQEFFHFPRIDILPAADDHVLRSAGEVNVSLLAHDADITRMQPALAIDCARGRLRFAIITLHDHISARANLALLADWYGIAFQRRHDLHLRARQRLANRRDPDPNRIIHCRHRYHRRALRLTVANRQFRAVHLNHRSEEHT